MSALVHHQALLSEAIGAVLGFDPVLKGVSAALDNSNFDLYTSASGSNRWALSLAKKSSGKWRQQFQVVTLANTMGAGIATGTVLGSFAGSNAQAACLFGNYGADLRLYTNGSYTTFSPGIGTGARIDVIVDIDAGKAWWAVNGTVKSGNPLTGASPMFTFTPGAEIRLCADTTGASGRIRMLQPAAFTGPSYSGYADGWV